MWVGLPELQPDQNYSFSSCPRSPVPTNMLAHLQKIITLGLVATAGAWLVCFYRSSPLLAVAGCLLIVLGYVVFLALELLLAHHFNRTDAVGQPTWRELLKAWGGEVLIAPQAFCWRQPFRSNAVADSLVLQPAAARSRGVVLIHGFFCNRGFWNPWLRQLKARNHMFVALSLESPFGSIDDYVAQIDAAVQRVREATGMPPLLVCHSMGGLAARAWLRKKSVRAEVHHVVTIGTPHHGTWLARFGHGSNGRQMRLKSDWLVQLDQLTASQNTLFTCWHSSTDNVVFPASSATLAGADNRLLRGVAHVQMAFLPQVMGHVFEMLDASPP